MRDFILNGTIRVLGIAIMCQLASGNGLSSWAVPIAYAGVGLWSAGLAYQIVWRNPMLVR